MENGKWITEKPNGAPRLSSRSLMVCRFAVGQKRHKKAGSLTLPARCLLDRIIEIFLELFFVLLFLLLHKEKSSDGGGQCRNSRYDANKPFESFLVLHFTPPKNVLKNDYTKIITANLLIVNILCISLRIIHGVVCADR